MKGGGMTDPAQPAVGQRLLTALRQGRLTVPTVELATDQLIVSALGIGESYAAWLVTDGNQSLVFRLPRRPPQEMPTPMTDEYSAAPFIPADVGSRPIAMDASRENELKCPYIVSTFVPGSVLAESEWDEPLLRAHARQLAQLHKPDFDVAGPLGGEMSTINIVNEFDGGFGFWRSVHPEVTGEEEVTDLAHDIRRRLLTAAPDFEGIRYSFIHGDLVATNVVVDSTRTPRYIDWEWARIGDVAQDLAYIGGEVTGGPWYVSMDSAMVTAYLTEYVAVQIAQPGEQVDSVDRLRSRRDAWELMERFLSSLHFSMKARTETDVGLYGKAVGELRSTLRTRLAA